MLKLFSKSQFLYSGSIVSYKLSAKKVSGVQRRVHNCVKMSSPKQSGKGSPVTVGAQKKGDKADTLLGITAKKGENHSEWYQQLMLRGELIEYYDISGCYIIRPWAFYIWSVIQEYIDGRIKASGVDNCYFPIFVSKKRLEKEKTHISGFSPEVAWITKAGNSDMSEPIAIRPTSETVMYPYYSDWIRSYRDLPLKLNMWNSVVRWEFKDPQPFIRTREFLWQEGHCAYATEEEAIKEGKFYQSVYNDTLKHILAIPTIAGIKSKNETFCGAVTTYTLESFISETGRGIQSATSHHLGQIFSKIFDIGFLDPNMERKHAWQISWGFSTRTIGLFIMMHSDDKGVVLTPKTAKHQVVIVPVGLSGNNPNKNLIVEKVNSIASDLNSAGIRTFADVAPNTTAGWKFSYWELKGVPVRLEIGPKEIENNVVSAVIRYNGETRKLSLSDLSSSLQNLFTEIHDAMYQRANEKFLSCLKTEETWDGFFSSINAKKMVLAPWCDNSTCEDEVRRKSARDPTCENSPIMGAKTLCIPYDQPKVDISTKKCFSCGEPAHVYALWGRSY